MEKYKRVETKRYKVYAIPSPQPLLGDGDGDGLVFAHDADEAPPNPSLFKPDITHRRRMDVAILEPVDRKGSHYILDVVIVPQGLLEILSVGDIIEEEITWTTTRTLKLKN